MNYAILITINGEETCLMRTTYRERAIALAGLCELHLLKVFPGEQVTARLSANFDANINATMHPDREWIIDKLREHEFPLPREAAVIDA